MPTHHMREVVEISKKGLLSFLREIPTEVLEEICEEVKREKTEEGKTSKEVSPCNVVLLVIVITILLAGCFIPLDRALPLNYGYSWVVFTLISMLSLQYVDFVNRLKDLLRRGKLLPGSRKEKAKKAAFLLQWTGLFFIITISALAIRIIWLSFSTEKLVALHKYIKYVNGPEAQKAIDSLGEVFLFFDWVIVASFFLGSFSRIVVFLHSYGGDLLKRWPWKCN